MKNVLTFDLEDWYQVNGFGIDPSDWHKYERRIRGNTLELLSILERKGTRATFFVLGSIAEEDPDLIQILSGAGHEIATHGFLHRLVYTQRREDFYEDLRRSIGIIEGITGRKVLGYRAPSWSVTEDTLWVFDILAELGLQYDSSLCPFKTYLYGMPDSPRLPHLRRVQRGEILEVPPSTVRIFGQNIPFSGGVFLRLWTYPFIRWYLIVLNRQGAPGVFYLHPWEFDVLQPRLRVPWKQRVMQYCNLHTTEKKLSALLDEFEFGSIEEVLLPSEATCLSV